MPIVAIGIDIVAVERLRGVYARHPVRFLQRHFTPEETAYCLAQADPLPALAARFAAKEAFQKCWPQSFGWREVWVEKEGGRPRLGYIPKIAQRMRAEGWRAHLSLSHEREHALAVVILEGLEGG